ncbi:MAG: serine/threonine protein kinase, partial [Acidobacteriia bacterium]|nr:serine/threonine protein kinase [Terriglobia bacterium]
MSLVDLALAQPAGERRAYLRSACDGNAALFSQAWHYVEWEERMGGFLLESLYSLDLADTEFQPGQLLLDGRFRIVARIGEGGMGIVYEAMDEKLGRRIAIKCAKAGFRKRLPPEVRLATEIGHPNVCKIFEIHTAVTDHGEVDFLTMEFLEGETLSGRLRTGPLPEKEVRAIAQQLTAGLAAAHRCRVIHGDLKSSNIILSKDAADNTRVVITDFGLARGAEAVAASVTSASFGGGAAAGTPDYMAPELWKGQQASVASDIYALGVIVYEMLAGTRLPGQGLPWEQRLTRKPPSVHPKWNAILACCLD